MNDLGPALIPELVEKLKRGGREQRRKAAVALGMIPAAVPALVALLGDEDAHVRRFSSQALTLLADDAAASLPSLLRLLDDVRRRGPALDALSALGPAARSAVPRLLRLLKDPDPDTRRRAVAALAAVGAGARRAIPALALILADPGQPLSVRRQTALALARMGAAGSRALAAAVRGGPGALGVLREMGPDAPETARALKDGLRHEARQVRCLAAEALGASFAA